MSAMVLDTKKINTYILPGLSKSKTITEEAYDIGKDLLNSLNNSFSQKSTVKQLINDIYQIKKDINDVSSMIDKKMNKANTIENKSQSKASSIASAASKIGGTIGLVGGSILGGMSSGVLGAAVGGVVGNKAGQAIGETGAKIATKTVSKVKGFFVNAWEGIKNTAAKVAKGVKSIWEKFSGSVSNIYNKAKDLTINTINKVKSTGARIVNNCKSVYSQIESGVSNAFDKIGAFTSKLCTAIGNGVETAWDWVTDADTWKKIGTTIADGVTAAWNWVTDPNTWKKIGASICKGFKTAWDWVKDIENWKKLGATIADGFKAAWNWAKDIENWKKLGASIVNLKIAFQKGLCTFAESIVDLAMLLGTALNTGYTAIQDVATAILTDGNLEWNATKKMWAGTKSAVTYNFTNKVYDKFYSSDIGKWLDETAYTPFKSDGVACKISSGAGYVAGVVVLSIVTFGAGGAALGAAAGTTVTIGGVSVSSTAVALTALGAGIGKYTAEEWNKNSLSISYGEQELGLSIDYEKYKEITGLKPGETTTIDQKITNADGSITELKFTITATEDGKYNIIDNYGNNVQFNGVKESSTIEGLLTGTAKGIGDGFKAFTTVSTMGNLQSFASMAKSMGGGNTLKGFKNMFSEFGFKQSVKPLVKSATTETFKDYGFYIDAGTHIYTDAKAAMETGEWNIFKTLAKVGGAYTVNWLGNLGGEYFKNGTKNIQLGPSNIETDETLTAGLLASSSPVIFDANSNIVGKDILPDGLGKLDDGIGSIQEVARIKPLEDYKSYDFSSGQEAWKAFGKMDNDVYFEFQTYKGSAIDFINDSNISPELRNKMKFFIEETEAGKIVGKLNAEQCYAFAEYSGEAYRHVNNYARTGKTSLSQSYLDDIIKNMDEGFAVAATPLAQDTLFYRGVDSRSFMKAYAPDGNIMALKGQTITDKGYMSTSIVKSCTMDYDVQITIKTPEGTKALNMMGISGNSEAEFLFGRNSKLHIEDITEVDIDGETGYNIIASLVDDTPDINISKLDGIVSPTAIRNATSNNKIFRTRSNGTTFDIQSMGTTTINGRQLYMFEYSDQYIKNRVIYSEMDLVGVFNSNDIQMHNFVENQLLGFNRVSGKIYNSNGYVGWAEYDEFGNLKKKRIENLEKRIGETATDDLDNFFNQYRTGLKNYGVDQHIAFRMIPANKEYQSFGQFERLRNILMNKGFDNNSAIRILYELDDPGACSYATVCNEIFNSFKGNEALFESTFGFPMFTTLDNGTRMLNGSELLVDLYTHTNDYDNGGRLFYSTIDGKAAIIEKDFNPPMDPQTGEKPKRRQKYMSDSGGKNSPYIDDYLKSKNINLDYSAKTMVNSTSKMYDLDPTQMTQADMNEMKGMIRDQLAMGNNVSIDLFQNEQSSRSVKMYESGTSFVMDTRGWPEKGEISGHSMFITNADNNGIYVSSWGEKYYITYDDLSYAPFTINTSSITSN